jgi:hypothetical protein
LLATIAAPSNLAGRALAPDRVALTWTESSTVSYFEVEWSNTGGSTHTARSYTTSYVVTGLTPSMNYQFRVRAARSASSFSTWTGPITVRTPATVSAPYSDGFTANPLVVGSPWTYTPTTTNDWVYGTDTTRGGVLQQIQNGNADPRKAMLTGLAGTPNDIYARVRIDTWLTGEYARAGVGLYTDPRSGQGYNLVFTGRWSNIDTMHPTHLEFLNDGVAWSGWLVNGSQTTVPYGADQPGHPTPLPGDWYWFHMTVSGGKLYGNVWKDGSAEPSGWEIVYDPASQLAQSQWSRTSGVAALTGSSTGTFPNEPPSGGAVSFDDVTVRTGVTVSTTTTTAASVSTSAIPLAPFVPGVGSADDATLTDLASELLRSRQKR